MKTIKQHVKNETFARAYLLYGEEKFLVRKYKNILVEAICHDDDMNFSYYEGKDADINDIKDNSDTMPFFADRKLILIENSGMFKTSSESMVDIVKSAPDSTYFIFVEDEVDKRNRLYKAVSEYGYVCEMKTQKDDDLSGWVFKYFKDAGLNITSNDMNAFLGIAGPDMDNLYNETMKIIAYCRGRNVVTLDDIYALCSPKVQDRVFDMIQAMAMKRTDEVLKLYSDLLALKEPPLKILAIIGKQFAMLLAVKELLKDNAGNSEIAQKLGIRPFFVGRYITQAKQFSVKEIREAVQDCVETECSVKTGRSEDKYAVELLILKYSGTK